MQRLHTMMLVVLMLLLPAAVQAMGCPMALPSPVALAAPCHEEGDHPQLVDGCACLDHDAVLPSLSLAKPAGGDGAILLLLPHAQPVMAAFRPEDRRFAHPPPELRRWISAPAILTVSQRFRI